MRTICRMKQGQKGSGTDMKRGGFVAYIRFYFFLNITPRKKQIGLSKKQSELTAGGVSSSI